MEANMLVPGRAATTDALSASWDAYAAASEAFAHVRPYGRVWSALVAADRVGAPTAQQLIELHAALGEPESLLVERLEEWRETGNVPAARIDRGRLAVIREARSRLMLAVSEM